MPREQLGLRPRRLSGAHRLTARCLLGGLLLVAASLKVAAAGALAIDDRATLLFSVDQGFPNGAVNNSDVAAIGRIADSLRVFQNRYRVMALLSSLTPRDKLFAAVDIFVAHQIPFVLDAISSDAIALRPEIAPFNAGHGIELPLEAYSAIRRRYGPAFAGIRIMEPFSMSFTVIESRDYGKTWGERFRKNWPSGSFYDPAATQSYIKFAAYNGMLAIVSDWLWSGNHTRLPEELHQRENENDLINLKNSVGNSLMILYANNEPDERSTFERWDKAMAPFRHAGIRNLGLSDQAWYYDDPPDTEMDCPVTILVSWAKRGLSRDAHFVQTEPYFYWWKLPKASGQNNYQTFLDANPRSGEPTTNLVDFAAAVAIKLPLPEK
jgi:hypothetical protein